MLDPAGERRDRRTRLVPAAVGGAVRRPCNGLASPSTNRAWNHWPPSRTVTALPPTLLAPPATRSAVSAVRRASPRSGTSAIRSGGAPRRDRGDRTRARGLWARTMLGDGLRGPSRARRLPRSLGAERLRLGATRRPIAARRRKTARFEGQPSPLPGQVSAACPFGALAPPMRRTEEASSASTSRRRPRMQSPRWLSPRPPFARCIMRTANRRCWVLCFSGVLAQDYPACELIILDDGDQAVATTSSLLTRRSATCAASVIAVSGRAQCCLRARLRLTSSLHWTDDDWYAPHRIRT